MNKNWKDIAISAMALTLISGVTTAALAGTNALTKDSIAARNEETQNASRMMVINADSFEEQSITDGEATITYYDAVKDGNVIGYVFTTVTNGKSSGLTVMTGVATDGTVSGVVITDDNETAGYVDKVTKLGLLDTFIGKPAETLKLGEDVDAISQATKTSRGVTDGVNKAISYYTIIKGGVA